MLGKPRLSPDAPPLQFFFVSVIFRQLLQYLIPEPEDPAVSGENAGVSSAARTPCGVDPRSGFSKLLRGSVHVPALDESAG